MGRVFLCVSAACVQRRRSGRYSPIDRTGLSDCQREFIFPTISLSLSLYLSHSPYQSSYLAALPPAARSLFLIPCARSLYRYPFSLTLPSIATPFFPSFPPPLSPSPAHHNRSSPVYFPSLHCTSFVFFALFLILASSLPPSSVVRDNSLVCSLITLRVYTPARTK